MTERNLRLTLRSTFTALFAALICVGCLISIPLPGGVPISVQNMFSILAGCTLGGIQGAGAVGLFIVLGAIGLPVFSGAVGGMAILIGPTGGYIWGYFLGALVAGLILGTPHTFEKKFQVAHWLKIALAAFLGYLIVYIPGVPWFRHVVLSNPENNLNSVLTPLSTTGQLKQVLAWTVIPFIPGDLIKLIITVPLAATLRPILARYLYSDEKTEEAELIAAMKAKKERMDAIASKFNGESK